MIKRRQFVHFCARLTGTGLLATHHVHGVAQASDGSGHTNILRVGRTRAIRTIGQAARLATAGSVVEVDAGDYVGDVAVWERDGVSVLAVGGRVKLLAGGASAEGKGIWVVRARNMRVQGIDFEGAKVASRNGAGIRLEDGSLHVRDCRFIRNEMGLLTGNNPGTELDVENCEFAYNYHPTDHNHNLYVGQIGRFSVTGSYFHHAHIGHLLKSRAAHNQILGNRLTDESGGAASYELEFPNGGVAYVIGNVIEQDTQTDNPHVISFGAEGYFWPRNEIYLVNNTLVDLLPRGGIFLRVAPGAGAIRAINNLLLGAGNLESAGPGDYRNNVHADPADFVATDLHDYRLLAGSPLVGKAIDPGMANGQQLRQVLEYTHPIGVRTLQAPAHNPGALQGNVPIHRR